MHNPGELWTMECHADSKNMNLSKRASISPPTETIFPSVLVPHSETFIHPTGCAVNWSPNYAFSLSVPLLFLPFFSGVLREEAESLHPNQIYSSHPHQHRRDPCNLLDSEFHACWPSTLSSSVYICFNLFMPYSITGPPPRVFA